MKVFVIIAFLASMCASPTPTPTPTDVSCFEAWGRVVDLGGCPGFVVLGYDDLPNTTDDVPWLDWCLEDDEPKDLVCIVASESCSEAEACLEETYGL
jgi:hypothetical protein